jgi:hypothetical protein
MVEGAPEPGPRPNRSSHRGPHPTRSYPNREERKALAPQRLQSERQLIVPSGDDIDSIKASPRSYLGERGRARPAGSVAGQLTPIGCRRSDELPGPSSPTSYRSTPPCVTADRWHIHVDLNSASVARSTTVAGLVVSDGQCDALT